MTADPAALLHYGDPCVHCGIAHDYVSPGPCQGDATKAVPIAYRKIETRWDGYDHHRVKYSDGTIRDKWNHASEHAPYTHWGRFDTLTQPPRWDPSL